MFKLRLLAILLLLPFIINGPFSYGEGYSSQNIYRDSASVESREFDQRAQVLSAYLEGYDSPLQHQAQHFVDAADKYNLDWRLVAAIAGTESTFGKAIPGGYNAWGWGVYGNKALGFKSWKDGIYTVSEGLRTRYLDKGLTDLNSINRVYAASNRWAFNVSYFMEDMEKFKNQYELDQMEKISSTTSFLAQRDSSDYSDN